MADRSYENDPETYRLASCYGKEAMDRPTATMIARKSKYTGVSAYQCKACGHWHVGQKHKPKRLRTRRKYRVV